MRGVQKPTQKRSPREVHELPLRVPPRGPAPLDRACLGVSPGNSLGRMDDEQDHTCPICLELLLRPVQLSCGHRFCRGCWTSVLQSHDVRATAHLTGSVACPYRCEVRPVVPEVDETLASQLESRFAAEYRERASSTSLPDEEGRVTEVNEWAAQDCKLDDTPGADEVTTSDTTASMGRREKRLTRGVVVISSFGAALLAMLCLLLILIVCFPSLKSDPTLMQMLFALTGLTATFILIDAFLSAWLLACVYGLV